MYKKGKPLGLWLVWFTQLNKTNQTNQANQPTSIRESAAGNTLDTAFPA
jgi:hypothetical protein